MDKAMLPLAFTLACIGQINTVTLVVLYLLLPYLLCFFYFTLGDQAEIDNFFPSQAASSLNAGSLGAPLSQTVEWTGCK